MTSTTRARIHRCWRTHDDRVDSGECTCVLDANHDPVGRAVRTMRMGHCIVALLCLWSGNPAAQQSGRMFVFRDNFWLNLHQFLRGEVYRRHASVELGLDTLSLVGADRVAWNRAVDDYGDLAKRDVLFDDLLRQITNVLTTISDTAALPDSLDRVIGTTTRRALNAAASTYRGRIWPSRGRDNEAWISAARTLVAAHEATMASRLAAAYRARWPSEPMLVDVVGEVGPNSAITYGGPAGFAAHIQVSAGSRRNTGDAPLELLFHEATHAAPVESRIQRMIQDESARQKVRVPEDLWHSLIMFTSGSIARQELARLEHRDYVPYADRYHQLTSVEHAAFERDWQPYLDERIGLEQALRDLVHDARLP
jgi:hypothetical protein